ncbi:MAG: membrane protein insertase YidC [Desulfobacteraceae bacterium]|nr:MAG: membrane protein insertase YidC [Desulfobacteraceae bacterium]
MEKRTIFAFVLSFLVLLAWSFFFSPREEQPQKQEPAVTQKEENTRKAPVKAPESPAPRPVEPPSKESPAPAAAPPSAAPKEVFVETPLYLAVFSNEGGTITSFKLKRYSVSPEPGSPPVELISEIGGQRDSMTISFEPAPIKEQKVPVYQVSEERIVVERGGSPKELTFRGRTSEGIDVTKTYRFYPDRYPVDLSVTAKNESGAKINGHFRASLRNTPPADKQSYYAFNGIALFKNKDLQELEPDDLKDGQSVSGRIQWVAYETDYFMTAFVPKDAPEASFHGRKASTGTLLADLTGPALLMEPGDQAAMGYTLYLGPRDLSILKEMNVNLDAAIDFGWTDVIAKPLLYALRFFQNYVGNYGVAIILLTVVIKILFWPLTHKSYKSMKEMQKIQPLMAKLREKYKGNREQMNKEMMALYRTYKVNPMGGCLPMVIQIPVFFALFRILGSAIELRHAPFLWWINDLSAPDRLFSFPFEIPFMTPPYGIPVLTLFMGASMFIQQKMTPTPGDATQAKIMMLMPVIFTVMFINFPSGLVLYWLVNNILSIGQQYRILKKPA